MADCITWKYHTQLIASSSRHLCPLKLADHQGSCISLLYPGVPVAQILVWLQSVLGSNSTWFGAATKECTPTVKVHWAIVAKHVTRLLVWFNKFAQSMKFFWSYIFSSHLFWHVLEWVYMTFQETPFLSVLCRVCWPVWCSTAPTSADNLGSHWHWTVWGSFQQCVDVAAGEWFHWYRALGTLLAVVRL